MEDQNALGEFLRSRRERLRPGTWAWPPVGGAALLACDAKRSRCWPPSPPITTPAWSKDG
ncbi:hypothetical protein SVIO_025060 [Streptomyces violaceusniger]|uniref:Uncharacterized protein n=1 Tax=Streptomyces violaceusniger TaxID=68280 RepID=A0A4D4L1M0_STRVO|nr:hypothetical protein SVIO_025060 [Streptomyces violaceusniger]